MRCASGDDVVALDVTKHLQGASGIGSIDFGSVVGSRECYSGFFGADHLERHERPFGIGTDLYMLGMLADEEDIGVNLPRARFGNLSVFANDKVHSEQGNGARRPCHLCDMRSRTGFSGSPVIGYVETTGLDGHVNVRNRLFGIHSAQHRERIDILGSSVVQKAVIASSMTRVVPAWIILDLIENNEGFRASRRGTSGKDDGRPTDA